MAKDEVEICAVSLGHASGSSQPREIRQEEKWGERRCCTVAEVLQVGNRGGMLLVRGGPGYHGSKLGIKSCVSSGQMSERGVQSSRWHGIDGFGMQLAGLRSWRSADAGLTGSTALLLLVDHRLVPQLHVVFVSSIFRRLIIVRIMSVSGTYKVRTDLGRLLQQEAACLGVVDLRC